MHLSGFNHFVDNVGGGISLLNSAMTVSGELLFDSNTASYGAGMSLDDICKVRYNNCVDLCVVRTAAMMLKVSTVITSCAYTNTPACCATCSKCMYTRQ